MRSTIPNLSCAARPCPHINGTAHMRDCAWPDCALISTDRGAGHDPRNHVGRVAALQYVGLRLPCRFTVTMEGYCGR